MREGLAWLRSSVVAVLCRLKLTVGDAATELGSLASTGMLGFWSQRGQMAALIIRGKMTLITTVGSNVRIAVWGPDLEDWLWRWKIEQSIPQGNKDLQASNRSFNMYNQKKSWKNEQKIEVSHFNRVSRCFTRFSDLSQVSVPEPINWKGGWRVHARTSEPGVGGSDADQLDRYMHEKGVQAECWPGGVRRLVIFRGIQQISKYIEHNGSQISSSWERQIQINTGKAVNPVGLVLDWNLRSRC